MDPIQIGTHAGSGLFGSILTFLGIRERIVKTEEDVKELKKIVVYQDTCTMCRTNTNNQFKSLHDTQIDMNKKLDILIERGM